MLGRSITLINRARQRAGCIGLLSVLACLNFQLDQRPKCFVHCLGIREVFSDIPLDHNNIIAMGIAASVFTPNATSKIIFWEHSGIQLEEGAR